MTFDQKICNFVWNNNKHLVSKASMLLPIELGGLKMISRKYVCSTAHIMFIKDGVMASKLNGKFLQNF